MRVLNIHTLKGVLSSNQVYIGNENKQYNLAKSKFANPFYKENWSKSKKIEEYEKWLINQLKSGEISKSELRDLFGKDLVCFCSPKPCHGHILREYVCRAYFDKS